MIFYIISLSAIGFFYNVGRLEKTNLRAIFLLLSFLGLWLLAGLRGDVGQDTFSYSKHFYELGKGISYLHYFRNIEPLFAVIISSTSAIFSGVTYFFLLFSLVQAIVLWMLLKRIWHSSLFLFSYLFIFYLDYHMNAIRGGLAILVFLLAMSYAPSRLRLSIFLFFASAMLHVSIFILAPFFVFRVSRYSQYKVSLWFGVFLLLVVMIFLMNDAILRKISVYFLEEPFDFRIPKVMMLFAIIGILAVLIQNRVSKEFLVVFSLVICSWILNESFSILYRVHLMLLLLMFYLVFEHRSASLRKLTFRPTSIYALGLVFWFSVGIFLTLPYEREQLLTSGKGNPDYAFVPYSFFWNSEFR